MALFIKTTFFFKSSQGGWSESWHDLTAGSLTTAEVNARNAGLKRLSICGLGVTFAGARVSDQDVDPKRSKLIDLTGSGLGNQEIVADAALTGYSDTLTRSADQLQTSLFIRGMSAAGARKNLWMGGIPDSLVRINPTGPDIGGSPMWVAKYMAWRTEFQSGRWGFRVRRRIGADVQPFKILDWTLQAGAVGRVGLVVANPAPAYVAGSRVQIRNLQMVNPALRSPLGTWTVHSGQPGADPTTFVFYLRGTEGIDPFSVFVPGNVRLVAYEAVACTDISIIRQSSHQRGRPFGLYRGRRSTPRRV